MRPSDELMEFSVRRALWNTCTAITAGIADLAGVDSAADTSFWSEVAIPAAERKVRLFCVAALLAAQ